MTSSISESVFSMVLPYLPDRDVQAMGLTCRQMREIAKKEFKRRDDELQALLLPFTLKRQFNVQEATQSRIFLLGEVHGQNIQDKSRIVFHLSNRAPVILLIEGILSMKECDCFFEKKWICPSPFTPENMAMLEPIAGVPYVRKNLMSYGWDGPLDSEEARAGYYKEVQLAEESMCNLFSSLPNLMESFASNAWLLLNEINPINDQAMLCFKIEMWNELVGLITRYFLKPLEKHPNPEQFFASWELNKSAVEALLTRLESDEELENQCEVNDLFKQAHEFFALLSHNSSSLGPFASALVADGLQYSCDEEKIEDLTKDPILSLCYAEDKRPFRERVQAALQKVQPYLSLLMIRMRVNPEFSFASIEKFVEEWNAMYEKKTRLTGLEPTDYRFPIRTTAMVRTLQNIREQTLDAKGKFVVVMAGNTHLENDHKSHYFDVTPLYEELAHHKAVIFTHSQIAPPRSLFDLLNQFR